MGADWAQMGRHVILGNVKELPLPTPPPPPPPASAPQPKFSECVWHPNSAPQTPIPCQQALLHHLSHSGC